MFMIYHGYYATWAFYFIYFGPLNIREGGSFFLMAVWYFITQRCLNHLTSLVLIASPVKPNGDFWLISNIPQI